MPSVFAMWFGFDYGQCLMDSRFRKIEYWLAATLIDEEAERGGTIDSKLNIYRKLVEKYGGWRKVMEKGRDEIHRLILDDNPVLIRRFYEVEQKLLKPAEGLEEALRYLKSKHNILNVVTDLGSGHALNTIQRFLNNHNIRHFFTNIYSPAGVVRGDGVFDLSFKGVSKEDGSMYDKMKEELKKINIDVKEAVIVGDDPKKDIEQAKKRGFITVHWVGQSSAFKEPSKEADYVITSFTQLKEIF